jgi:hypothetical protein
VQLSDRERRNYPEENYEQGVIVIVIVTVTVISNRIAVSNSKKSQFIAPFAA